MEDPVEAREASVNVLVPVLMMVLALAFAAFMIVTMRLRLARLAEALGAEVTWRGLSGQRRGQPFRYCSGGKNKRPRLSVLDVPVGHELAALSSKSAGCFGARWGLEQEVAGIETAFDGEVAVFSEDEEFARALLARPEARRLVTELVQGSRDKLVIAEERVALELGRGWRRGRDGGLGALFSAGGCSQSPERLSAGIDRLVALVPLVAEAARRAPEPVGTWRRWLRRNAPWALPIGMALLVAVGVVLQAWLMKH